MSYVKTEDQTLPQTQQSNTAGDNTQGEDNDYKPFRSRGGLRGGNRAGNRNTGGDNYYIKTEDVGKAENQEETKNEGGFRTRGNRGGNSYRGRGGRPQTGGNDQGDNNEQGVSNQGEGGYRFRGGQNRFNSNRQGGAGGKPNPLNEELRQKEDEYINTFTKDTKIPEKPKVEVKEPKKEDRDKKSANIKKEIEALYEKKKQIIENDKQKKKEERDSSRSQQDVAMNGLMEKISRIKDVRARLNNESDKLNRQKAELDLIDIKINNIVNRVPRGIDKSQQAVQERINEINYIIKNKNVSLQDDKNYKKEIATLQEIYPTLAPLKELEDQRRLLQPLRKELGTTVKKLIEERNAVNQEIEDYKKLNNIADKPKVQDPQQQQQQQLLKQQQQQQLADQPREKKPLDPKIEAEINKINQQIDQLRKDQDKLYTDFNADYDNYRRYQFEIRKIEWMTNERQYLLEKEKRAADVIKRKEQEEKRKIRDAERNKLEEEQNKKIQESNKVKLFENEIEICSALIAYLNNYLPNQAIKVAQTEEKVKIDYEQINMIAGDLKKDKLIVAKRKFDEDEPIISKKQGKGEKGQAQQKEEISLIFTPDTLESFDQLKVNIPKNVSDVPNVILAVEEKKKYYLEQQKLDLPATPEQQQQQGEQQQQQGEQQQQGGNKKGNRGRQYKKVDFQNNEDFPSI